MKLIASALVLLASSTSTAIAQPTAGNTIGADVAFVLPVDDAYRNTADFGVGPLARVEVPFGPGYYTGRAGFLWHKAAIDDVSFLIFPIYGGYRYPVGTSGAYAAGEAGLSILYADTPAGSETDTRVGMTLGGGFRKGSFDVRAAVFLPDVDLDEAMGIIASVGFDFATF